MIPTRRQFVASSVATLPFLFHAPVAAQPNNPLLDEILQQMLEALRESDRDLTTSARRQVSALRMLAAFGETQGWDARFRAALRKDVRQRGRDALIQERPDFTAQRREMERRGVRHLRADELPLDVLAKGQAIDRLLARGVTPMLRDAARRLELLIPELSQLRPVRQTKQEQRCQELAGITQEMEILMTFSCAFLYWGVWPPCAINTVAYFVWKVYIADTYNCY